MKISHSIVASFLICFFSACSTTSSPQGFMKNADDLNRNSTRLTQLKKELCEKGSLSDCADYGASLWTNGDQKAAKTILSEACEKDDRKSCLKLGQLNYRMGNLGEAQSALSELCNEKPGVECGQAAEIAAIQGNSSQTLGFLKKSCQAGLEDSCILYGQTLRIQNRPSEATPWLRKACDAKVTPACTELAMILWGEGKEEAAIQSLDSDCERQSDRACRWGNILRLKRANPQFLKLQESLCKSGEKEACHAAALLQLFRKGGRNLALYRFKVNCDSGHLQSCWDRLIEINGIKPARSYADEIEALCKKDLGVACYQEGFIRKDEGEVKTAYVLWAKACEKGVSWGCHQAAQNPEISNSERLKNLRLACDQGLLPACKDLGSDLYWSGEKEEGEKFLRQACPNQSVGDCLNISAQSSTLTKMTPESLDQRCDQADSRACFELGTRLYQSGKLAEAKIAVGKSCDAQDAEACAYLGQLAKKSDQPDEAKSYYRKACDLQSTAGCQGILEFVRAELK